MSAVPDEESLMSMQREVQAVLHHATMDQLLTQWELMPLLPTDEDPGADMNVEEFWRTYGSDPSDEYADDVTGLPLPRHLVLQAREEELRDYKDMKVYEEVPLQECYDMTGAPPISTKWRDINKGDMKSVKVRSRLVSRQFRQHGVESIFTGTPPWSAFRALLSSLVTRRGSPRCRSLLLLDIKRAFLHTPTRSLIYVLPPHLVGTDRVWKLLRAMYGTLSAAADYQAAFGSVLIENAGMSASLCSPCIYSHPTLDVRLVFHGDDIAIEGDDEENDSAVEHVRAGIAKSFQVVTKARLGFLPRHDKEGTLLNRSILIEGDSVTIEADTRHSDLLLAGVGLLHCKGAVSPECKLSASDYASQVPLGVGEASQFRALAARARYLSEDRPDLCYASNFLCRGMSNPTSLHVKVLKKMMRYLRQHRRLVIKYKPQDEVNTITAFTDADHASDQASRQSTTGYCIMRGSHWLSGGTSTQSTVALSSGESEFLASLKTAKEGLGMASVLEAMNLSAAVELCTDSAASYGLTKRQGHSSRTKHLEAQYLWIQQAVSRGRLMIRKIPRSINNADMWTKSCNNEDMKSHLSRMNMEVKEGDAPHALR
eukprot:3481614-Amphidinium_carterae.1